MSIEGQGHSFTIYFPGFVCFVLYLDKISGERLQDHWSSGHIFLLKLYHHVYKTISSLCYRKQLLCLAEVQRDHSVNHMIKEIIINIESIVQVS